jgi:AcrR family transcriptional regulator
MAEPTMTRVRNKADKQARIAAAARELFEERGFDETTIRAIAERAGVATGTVLLYGESKAELLLRLFVDELAEEIEQSFLSLDRAAALPDQILHLLSGFVRRYARRPALARVYVKETLFVPPSPLTVRYETLTQDFIGRLAVIIAEAPDRPASIDPFILAAAVFGLYLLHVAQLLGQSSGPDRELDTVLGSLHRAVAAIVVR